MTPIKTVGIVGAGQMGSGIAQVFAAAGFAVIIHDVDEARGVHAKASIARSLQKLIEKGKVTAEAATALLTRIALSTALDDFTEVDLAIEAATEDLNVKLKIFSKLDGITKPAALLASNTSSLSITAIAGATARPDKVIGMHFMNPVPRMKGIEIIRGLKTSDATESVTLELVEALGKSAIRSQDSPGFVANRILIPMIREAMQALEDGVADRDNIDRCMVDCCNFPMGPLALADLIGLDTCAAIMHTLADGLGNDKYRPPKLLEKMIAAGKLGRKTKRGFYDY